MNDGRGRHRREALRRQFGVFLLSFGLLVSAPGLAAQSALGAKFAAFLEAFHHAFRNHDRDAAAALFFWRGVTESDRTRIMALLDRDLALDLRGVRLVPPGETTERFETQGIPMRKNLAVVARLLAQFADGEGKTRYSLHELGLEDNAFYIVLSAPETGI